jgi:hypothetical protein
VAVREPQLGVDAIAYAPARGVDRVKRHDDHHTAPARAARSASSSRVLPQGTLRELPRSSRLALVIAVRRLQAVSGPAIVAMALALCAWFATRAVAAWAPPDAEKKFAAVTNAAAAPPPPATPRPAPPPRDGAALVARNMFCSSCVGKEDDGPKDPEGNAPVHTLPRVIATHVGAAGDGWATLEIAGLAGGFTVGATLPGGGVIAEIERGAIFVRFGDGVTRVPLAAEGEVVGGMKPDSGTAAKPDAKPDPWADRIRAVGDNRWEVDRTLIRELVQAGTTGNPAAKGVRLQPVSKDGKLAGVRVATSRSGSLSHALGLSTGDVIESIDGQAIDSPQVLMKMYDKLNDLRRVDLGVRRKGANVTLTYDLP